MRQRYASDIGPVYDLNEIEEVLGHRESDQVMELSRRLTTAEQERDSLKQQLAEANAELDMMTELMKKQNAACAATREALEICVAVIDEKLGDTDPIGYHEDTDGNVDNLPKEIVAMQKAIRALTSSSAGKDLLERARKAEGLLKEIQGRLGSDCSYECSTCELTDCKEGQIYKDIDAFLKGGGKE